MVLVDAAVQVTICCVTYWTDMRIIPVTSECADVSLHNRTFILLDPATQLLPGLRISGAVPPLHHMPVKYIGRFIMYSGLQKFIIGKP